MLPERQGNSEPVVIGGNDDRPRNNSRFDSCGSRTVTCLGAEISGKPASKTWRNNCAPCRRLLRAPRLTARRSASFLGARCSLGQGHSRSPSPCGATDYTRRVVLRPRPCLPPAVGSPGSDLGLRGAEQLSRRRLDLFLPPRCGGRRGSLCRDHSPMAVACRLVSLAAALAA